MLIFSNFTFARPSFVSQNLGGFVQRELEVGYPEVGGVRPEDTSIGLPTYVKYIFNFSLGIAGLIVFIVLVYGGFRYLTSAGNPTKMGDARDQIFAAFLGLAVLVGSYLILTTINPQLVFLGIPERVILPEEPLIRPEPKEKEILYYTEISIGGLVEELFSEERTEKIKDVSEKLKNKSEEVKTLSEELEALTDACSCSLCDHGDCDIGSCYGNQNCVSNCQCVGEPYGENDPCTGAGRRAINRKKEELRMAIGEAEDGKGSKYWQEQLDVEINGSPEEAKEEEKVIGFRQVYEDLESAEGLVKECSLSSNTKGNNQILLGYNNFWQYREALEKEQKIKGVEPEYPFDYVSSENSYYLATFYCAEIFQPSLPEISWTEDFEQVELEVSDSTEEMICGDEIAIGETVDNAEELAKKMLVELDNINNNALAQIEAIERLVESAEECGCNNCVSDMVTTNDCCDWQCIECCPPPEEEEEDWEQFPPGGRWWEFWMLKPLIIYAAEEDCEYGCCDSSCSYEYCSSCSCVCLGHPNPEAIGIAVSQIQNNYSEIEMSFSNLKNLIEEKEIGDELKISEIFKNLNVAQNQLGPCYNSEETQRKLGTEKVLWRELYDCSTLKQYKGWGVTFYNEEGKEITECYGASQAEPDIFDNFLCCQTEMF